MSDADYIKDPSKVLEKVQEIIVIDLLEHVLMLDHNKHIKPLIDPPGGLYIKGRLKPILEQHKKYYFKSMYGMPEGQILKNIDILSSKEDIVNEDNVVVLPLEYIIRKKRYLCFKPDIPVVAIDLAIVLVQKYLNNLCPQTRTVSKNTLDSLIKPEYHSLIEDEEYENAFENLLNIVFEFVNRDVYHIYFHRQIGTTLVIEKVIDHRIYMYYQLMNKQLSIEEKFTII